MKKEAKIVIIEQVPRGKWDQQRVDGLTLDRNGIYIYSCTIADTFIGRGQKVEGVHPSFSIV